MQRASIVIAVAIIAVGSAMAQGLPAEGAEGMVNLTAQNEDVGSVAARISEQTGTQIAVTGNTGGTLTGKLENRTVEDSVKLLAQASQASWLRAYILESSPPEEPCSAEELLAMLRVTRDRWTGSITDAQRMALFGQVMRTLEQDGLDAAAEAAEAGRQQTSVGRMLAGPGGGLAVVRTAGGQPQTAWTMLNRYDDPIQRLLLAERSETVSLDVDDAPLAEALSAFTMSSRFFVVVEDGIDGKVTLSLDDAPLAEALDAFAEATGSQWREFYVIGQPRALTETEIAQRDERHEEQFTQLWGQFWERNPQERSTMVQLGVLGIEELSSRMNSSSPETREILEQVSHRAFDFMVGYSTQLTPEQRLELKPILQALARMRAT